MEHLSLFTYTFYAEEVLFGVGALARLGEVANRYGFGRLLRAPLLTLAGVGISTARWRRWATLKWSCMKACFHMSPRPRCPRR